MVAQVLNNDKRSFFLLSREKSLMEITMRKTDEPGRVRGNIAMRGIFKLYITFLLSFFEKEKTVYWCHLQYNNSSNNLYFMQLI